MRAVETGGGLSHTHTHRATIQGSEGQVRQKLKVNIIQLNYKLFPAHLDEMASLHVQLKK